MSFQAQIHSYKARPLNHTLKNPAGIQFINQPHDQAATQMMSVLCATLILQLNSSRQQHNCQVHVFFHNSPEDFCLDQER